MVSVQHVERRIMQTLMLSLQLIVMSETILYCPHHRDDHNTK